MWWVVALACFWMAFAVNLLSPISSPSSEEALWKHRRSIYLLMLNTGFTLLFLGEHYRAQALSIIGILLGFAALTWWSIVKVSNKKRYH